MPGSASDFHYGDITSGKAEAPAYSHLLTGSNGESILTTRQDAVVYSPSNHSLPALEIDYTQPTTDTSKGQVTTTDSSTQTKPSWFSDAQAALPDLWSGAKDEVINHPWQVAKSFGEGVAEGAVATAAVVGIAAISAPVAIGVVAVAGAVGAYEAGSALTKWVNAGSTLENPEATSAQTQAAHDTLYTDGHAVADTSANIIGGIAGAGAASFGINALAAAARTAVASDSAAPLARESPAAIKDPALTFSETVQSRTTEQFPNATGADRSFAEFLTARATGSGYPDTALWATQNLTEPEQIGQFATMYANNNPGAIKNMASLVGSGDVADGTASAWNVALSHVSALVGDQSGAAWYAAAAKSN